MRCCAGMVGQTPADAVTIPARRDVSNRGYFLRTRRRTYKGSQFFQYDFLSPYGTL